MCMCVCNLRNISFHILILYFISMYISTIETGEESKIYYHNKINAIYFYVEKCFQLASFTWGFLFELNIFIKSESSAFIENYLLDIIMKKNIHFKSFY